MTSTSIPSHDALHPLTRSALAGGAAAASLNTALYAIARFSGVTFVAAYPPRGVLSALPPFMPAVASFFPALLAGVVVMVLRKLFSSRVAAIAFAALCLVALAASLIGPLTLPAADAATRGTLVAMHVIAAASIAIPFTLVMRREGGAA